MEKDQKKKKKLTLTVSSTPHRATHYAQSKGKTSVVIEKKPQRKWGGKKFQPKERQKRTLKMPHYTLRHMVEK